MKNKNKNPRSVEDNSEPQTPSYLLGCGIDLAQHSGKNIGGYIPYSFPMLNYSGMDPSLYSQIHVESILSVISPMIANLNFAETYPPAYSAKFNDQLMDKESLKIFLDNRWIPTPFMSGFDEKEHIENDNVDKIMINEIKELIQEYLDDEIKNQYFNDAIHSFQNGLYLSSLLTSFAGIESIAKHVISTKSKGASVTSKTKHNQVPEELGFSLFKNSSTFENKIMHQEISPYLMKDAEKEIKAKIVENIIWFFGDGKTKITRNHISHGAIPTNEHIKNKTDDDLIEHLFSPVKEIDAIRGINYLFWFYYSFSYSQSVKNN